MGTFGQPLSRYATKQTHQHPKELVQEVYWQEKELKTERHYWSGDLRGADQQEGKQKRKEETREERRDKGGRCK